MRRDDIGPAADLLMLTSASGVPHHVTLQLTAAEAGEQGHAFVAERDGRIAGAALLSSDPVFPGLVITLVAVAEPYRGRGVGGALADLLDERLAHESLPASCHLRDDRADGRRFAERRGFAVKGDNLGWSFDLAAEDGTLETRAREAARSAGVRIRRADMATEPETVLECALRCMPGLPSDQSADPEQGRHYFPPDAILLLAEQEEPDESAPRALGITVVAPRIEEGVWYTMFTGVDASYRRRGIARALKTEAFLRARRAGGRSVVTHNHETNESVLGLNKSFGMQPTTGYWDLRRAPLK
ncbi:GNAT family N-acetyltransferase [Nonomuraea terrae]|uniref:GNAT family N-acetyltransferase n=1 Tax=Nonomuraea terrae TaxID=2530383 RepID=A0A4R4XXW6_9ACTN|nr:GNAT family N-acetyltransferase [Nonomuraea terrae]TDD36436.1 GNAT family N-acetyltransferase [Nonomuraea terrae]